MREFNPATLTHPSPETSDRSLVMRNLITQAGVTYTDPTTEVSSLEMLLDAHESLRRPYEIVPIQEAGYVVRFTDTEVDTAKPWLLVDFDDTLIATTVAKQRLAEAYGQHLAASGLDIRPEDQKSILKAADNYARWVDCGEKAYHLEANIAALAWATNTIQEVPGLPSAAFPKYIEERLARAENLPFHFAGDTFVVDDPHLVTPELSAIFLTLVRPEIHQDELQRVENEIAAEQPNSAIFTFGQPFWQLFKYVSVFDHHAKTGQQPLKPSQIWLTTVSKGLFGNALGELNQADGPAGMTASEIFKAREFILYDDDPSQLNGFLDSVFPGQLHGIRPRRQGTKKAGDSWDRPNRGNTIEFDALEVVSNPSNRLHQAIAQVRGDAKAA